MGKQVNEQSYSVLDEDGVGLFYINHIPPIGSTIGYYVQWNVVDKEKHDYTSTCLQEMQEMDTKRWRVVDVCTVIRNYGKNGTRPSVYIRVEEIRKGM